MGRLRAWWQRRQERRVERMVADDPRSRGIAEQQDAAGRQHEQARQSTAQARDQMREVEALSAYISGGGRPLTAAEWERVHRLERMSQVLRRQTGPEPGA